jgi:hypothetical protein
MPNSLDKAAHYNILGDPALGWLQSEEDFDTGYNKTSQVCQFLVL